MQDREPIRIIGGGEIPNLTPDVIADLQDILQKWGKINPAGNFVVFSSGPLRNQAQITLLRGIETPDLLVVAGPEPTHPHIVPVYTTRGQVDWDSRLTAATAKESVELINGQYAQRGLYDAATNVRTPVPATESIVSSEYFKFELGDHSAIITIPEQVVATIGLLRNPDEAETFQFGPITIIHHKNAAKTVEVFQTVMPYLVDSDTFNLRAKDVSERDLHLTYALFIALLLQKKIWFNDFNNFDHQEKLAFMQELLDQVNLILDRLSKD